MAPTQLIYQNGHVSQDILKKHKSIDKACNGIDSNGLGGQRDVSSNNNTSLHNNNNTKPSTKTDDKASKSAQALVEVRRQFLEYAEANPDKVNDRDKHKLATDDWYLKRYLLARNRRVKETMNMLRTTMEWRNEFGIHISEDAMFPSEFYKIGALFPYENDKKDNLVLYLRIKYHRKVVEMVEVEKHFLVHTFEKIDRITNGQGLVILFDCQGAGYANCDIDFLQFLISCATEHAPVGLQYIIVYKLPWVLNAFWSLVKKLLPSYLASRVRFCDENSITEYIDPSNLPDFMGGSCRRNYRWIPPGCPSVFKLANAYGISDAEINKILPQFQSLLDEAEEAMVGSSYEDPPETVTKYVNNAQTAPDLLSDLALCDIGLGSKEVRAMKRQQQSAVTESPTRPNEFPAPLFSPIDNASVVRIFPKEFIEFNYDAYNDIFHGSVTIYNPSNKNSLAFKLMSNRPSNYSVKPARGVLLPGTTITLSIILLDQHKSADKFLIVAQPIEGEVQTITKAQFDSLWSSSGSTPTTPTGDRQQGGTQLSIERHMNCTKLGSYLRKVVTTPAIQSSIKNPQVYELVSTCRSLKRRQNLSIIINVILLIIIINLLFFNL